MSIAELQLPPIESLQAEIADVPIMGPDSGHSLSLPPKSIIQDKKARWGALKNAADIIAEVHTRAGGVDYLTAKADMEKAAQQVHIEISGELRRPELPFGECQLHPFYRAGAMIGLAEELEQSDIRRLAFVREQIAISKAEMEAD